MPAERTMELIDTGANLTHDSFDSDRGAVLAAAASAGVHRMIVTGTSVEASAAAAALAAEHPGRLYATAGIHPHHATDCNAEALVALGALVADVRVVAVGECGLDYFRNFSPPAAQRQAFEAQLQLAVDAGLPVFLHQRDAHEDFLAIVREFRSGLVDAVAHCFTGGGAHLRDYLELDLHIGVTGWVCDERRGSDLQAAITDIPPERLLVETDAPYLLPRTIEPRPKSRRNEPAFLPYIVRQIAALTGRSAEAVALATTENAARFFRLPAAMPTM